MKKIVCFHLYNDYSGSPKVLKSLLEGLLKKKYCIDLITSSGGVLSELSDSRLKSKTYTYQFSQNPLILAFRYLFIQVYTAIYSLKYVFEKDCVFYINTILPIGPALAGFIMRKKVVYHYHENAKFKGRLYMILSWCMQKIASDIICVSEYQKSFLARKTKVIVVPNTVSLEFSNIFSKVKTKKLTEKKTVLMISSLKAYKGISEFIELSKRLPSYKFCLVINDTRKNINEFLKGNNINNNLIVYDRQQDTTPFYMTANVVVSLTNSQLVIETFGLTALEAMTAGLPVIVPTAGGIAELVEDGFNGYRIDVAHLALIAEKIEYIFTHEDLYEKLSFNAKQVACKFSYDNMITKIEAVLN